MVVVTDDGASGAQGQVYNDPSRASSSGSKVDSKPDQRAGEIIELLRKNRSGEQKRCVESLTCNVICRTQAMKLELLCSARPVERIAAFIENAPIPVLTKESLSYF